MKSKAAFTAIALGAVGASGCQIAGVKGYPLHRAELVDIVTSPGGATATTMYGESCTTPCRVSLLRSRGGKVTIEMPGYYTVQADIGSHVDNVQVGLQTLGTVANAVDPDPYDIAVDAIFGAIDPVGQVKRLDRNRVIVELEPLYPAAPDEEEELPETRLADETPEAAEELPG